MVGIGTTGTASEVIDLFHAHDSTSPGFGLAGLVSRGLGAIPGVGGTLAAGGWGAIAATSLIGIGGVLLANWMEKHEDPTKFHWSKVIRYGSLATSMLISLPAILTGVSIGITFLSSLFISQASTFNALTAGLNSTIGSANMAIGASSGGSVLATLLPHLLSCGAGILPVSLAYFMNRQPPSTRIEASSVVAQSPQKPLHHAAQAL